MIPKGRLDEEIAKRKAIEADLAKLADEVLAEVPEHLKPLIPAGLGAAERIAWYRGAKATGVFAAKPTVPATEHGRPTTTPREGVDLSTLSPLAKIAAGYRK
ncbi:MAG: hypothetical protein U1E62_21455 [Alsobacter sp.]